MAGGWQGKRNTISSGGLLACNAWIVSVVLCQKKAPFGASDVTFLEKLVGIRVYGRASWRQALRAKSVTG
jgi:hypothetical protein